MRQAIKRDNLGVLPESEILGIKRDADGSVTWTGTSVSRTESFTGAGSRTFTVGLPGRWAGVQNVTLSVTGTTATITAKTPGGSTITSTTTTSATASPTPSFIADEMVTNVIVSATVGGATTFTLGLSGEPEMLF